MLIDDDKKQWRCHCGEVGKLIGDTNGNFFDRCSSNRNESVLKSNG